MLYFYAAFTSCYRLPGSSAGVRGFLRFLGEKIGPDLEGVTYAFPLVLSTEKRLGQDQKAAGLWRGPGKSGKKIRILANKGFTRNLDQQSKGEKGWGYLFGVSGIQ